MGTAAGASTTKSSVVTVESVKDKTCASTFELYAPRPASTFPMVARYGK
jgi:hypothetical protein